MLHANSYKLKEKAKRYLKSIIRVSRTKATVECA